MEEFESLSLPIYIKEHLDILFCGINPGRISALKGYYFANPANLFWKAMYLGGLTPYQLKPEETEKLLDYGYGITDIVKRPTRSLSGLSKDELKQGAIDLAKQVQKYRPKILCFIGITAFRYATGHLKGKVKPGKQAGLCFQDGQWEGCHVFVIPSTSGANAHFTREERIGYFKELKEWKNQLI